MISRTSRVAFVAAASLILAAGTAHAQKRGGENPFGQQVGAVSDGDGSQ